RLAKTLGLDPIGRVTQRRAKLAPGVVLGEGKLQELARWTGGTGEVPAYESPAARRRRLAAEADAEADAEAAEADEVDAAADEPDAGDAEPADTAEAGLPARKAEVVLVDHDLTPTQHHNLERATGVDVL